MCNDSYKSAGRDRGFTLVELLVVIGIIALLIGILLPALISVRNSAKRSAISYQLQMIAHGLEAYKSDFSGEYPAICPGGIQLSDGTTVPDTGPYELCRMLFGLAPGSEPSGSPAGLIDMNEGPGFRIKAGGKVYGPYLLTDNFRFAYALLNNGVPELSPAGTVLQPPDYARLLVLDSIGNPILYFPAAPVKPRFASPNVTPASNPVFLAQQLSQLNPTQQTYYNLDYLYGPPTITTPEMTAYRGLLFQPGEISSMPTQANYDKLTDRISFMLGDADHDKHLDNGETLTVDHPYVLWSAGIDGVFGPIDGKKYDDVLLTE